MSNYWLWITVPIGLICLVALPIFVWRLIDTHRSELVLSVPLLADQEISIEATGSYLLNAEGPRATRAFGGLDYQLTDLSDQSRVSLGTIVVPYTSSGISRSRLSVRTFEVEKPGRFRLSVSGLSDPSVADRNNLVVTRDRRGRKVGAILLVVFSAIGLAAGGVFSAIIFVVNR